MEAGKEGKIAGLDIFIASCADLKMRPCVQKPIILREMSKTLILSEAGEIAILGRG